MMIAIGSCEVLLLPPLVPYCAIAKSWARVWLAESLLELLELVPDVPSPVESLGGGM